MKIEVLEPKNSRVENYKRLVMTIIFPSFRTHKGEGGDKGGIWRNLREGGEEC